MLGRLIIQARPRHLALALLIYAPVAVVMFGRWPGSLAAISRACDGLRPFDVRKSWGADDARALVDACGADGRSAYLHQQLLDLVYPTVLAAALLVTIALRVRRYGTRAWPTLLPVLLMTALDYAENAGIWTLLARWPHVDATVANLAGTATTAKFVIGTVAFCTPLVAGTVELAQRLRHRRAKAPASPLSTIPIKARLAAVLVLAAVGAGATGWLAGWWPGDDPHATLDHCYVTYDRQEQRHSRCIGNWTRGSHGYSGPVHGVAVEESWQILTVEPNSAYEWEVAVPAGERQPRVLADTNEAWTLSPGAARSALTPMAAGALLVALAWAVVSVAAARRRARVAEPAPLNDVSAGK